MRTKIQSVLMMTFLGGMFTLCVAMLNHTNDVTPLTSTETISYEDIHSTEKEIANTDAIYEVTVGKPLEEVEEIVTEETAENTTEETTEVVTEQPTEPEVIEETVPVNTNRWGISLTDSEIDLLARILWNEARGECKEGQIAVVEVVFNRMLAQSQDLTSILSAKNQFASWKNRNLANNYGTQVEIVKEVLAGNTNVLEKNVMYFAMWPLGKNVVKVIGCHYFSTDWCAEVAYKQGK